MTHQDRIKVYHRDRPGRSDFNDTGSQDRYQKPFSKRVITIIILLLVVFTLGLSNALSVLNSGDPEIDPNRSNEAKYTTVSGKVIDKNNGNELAGTTVTILGTNKSVITNSDGWFTVQNVRTGKQELRAEKTGYKAVIKKVDISSSELRLINFQLLPGDGQVVEDIWSGDTDDDDNINSSTAGMIILFASFAVLAILLVASRRMFWLAAITVIISMLSIGYFIGTIAGGIALVFIFTIKNDFIPVWSRRVRTQRRPPTIRPQVRPRTTRAPRRPQPARIRKSESPPPPPPPPPPKRYSRFDGKPLPRPPKKNNH